MDIADDVVNVFLIDNDFGVATLNEAALQVFNRRVVNVNSLNLRTGNHAVAYLRVGKVEGIVENLDFLVHLVIVGGMVKAALYQIVQINLAELLLTGSCQHLDTKDAKHNLG